MHACYTGCYWTNKQKKESEREGTGDGTRIIIRIRRHRKGSIYLSSMIVIDSIACSLTNLRGTTPRFVFELIRRTYIAY